MSADGRQWHVVIAGLGLMGGSLARAWQGQVGRLTGVDPEPGARRAALAEGVVQAALPGIEGVRWQPSDLLVLATPVQTSLAILQRLPRLAPQGCQVFDLGSTKAAVVAAMDALPPVFQAVGGHPMCGREVSGWGAGSADLFHRQTFVLSPTQRTTPALRAALLALIAAVGAQPLWLDAVRHDQIVALTSHLPYILAALLMQQVAEAAETDPAVWPVSGGGLRDMTRLAGSDPTMMRDILITNRQMALAALDDLDARLASLRTLVATGDAAALAAWTTAARANRRAYWQAKWDNASGVD